MNDTQQRLKQRLVELEAREVQHLRLQDSCRDLEASLNSAKSSVANLSQENVRNHSFNTHPSSL